MSVEFIGDDGEISEVLNQLRSEENPENWEQLTNEKAIRHHPQVIGSAPLATLL
jgi:hypothetical protein